MSRNSNNKQQQAKNHQTTRCQTCEKAGKPASVYLYHNTKNSQGTVVCPTILSTVCGHCNETGHWAKYCPVIKNYERIMKKTEHTLDKLQRSPKAVLAPTVAPIPKTKNPFDILADIDNANSDNANSDNINSDKPKNQKAKRMTTAAALPEPIAYAPITSYAPVTTYASVTKLGQVERGQVERGQVERGQVERGQATSQVKRNVHHCWADDEYWN